MQIEHPSKIKSKQWIFDALISLMEIKSFKSITITEITDKALLDRSTYYQHFTSKEEILKMKIDEITYTYIYKLKELKVMNIKNILKQFFEVCENNLKFIILLFNNDLEHWLLKMFNEKISSIYEMFLDRYENQIDSSKVEYALLYSSGGIWNMIIQWISQGMQIPIDDLRKACYDMHSFA